MLERKVIVQNEAGLHARPANELVQTAQRFSSDVFITKADKKINAKSILGVLSLAAAKGTELLVSIDGSDEEEAMQSIIELFGSHFGENKE